MQRFKYYGSYDEVKSLKMFNNCPFEIMANTAVQGKSEFIFFDHKALFTFIFNFNLMKFNYFFFFF